MKKYMTHSYELQKGQEAEEMVALLQKSIRRSEIHWTYFAAMNLFNSQMGDYIWERLIIIAAEDMYGTSSSVMKKYADQYFQAKLNNDKDGMIKGIYNGIYFAANGLKSRDADNLICLLYFNEINNDEIKAYVADKDSNDTYPNDPNIFNVKTYKFEENKGWLKYIADQNNSTADYVSFPSHSLLSEGKNMAIIKAAFKEYKHEVVAYHLYTMIDNGKVNEAWTLLRDLYVKSKPELMDEFNAMVFAKEQISQQKESKLYIGKIITLWILLNQGVDISNNVEIKYDENFIKKYYDDVNPAYIPAYTYDLHTERGRLMKFTQREFLSRENAALTPKAKHTLFDKLLEDNIFKINR